VSTVPPHVGRRRRLAAYLFVVLMGAVGFLRVEQERHRACERGNDFRQEDMPAAFTEYTLLLGEEFEAPPERARGVAVEFDGRIHRLFPPVDCGWWP
jgi:hypothetical protein